MPRMRAVGESELTEAALVQRAKQGEHGAFEMIMRRYNRRLYRMARASLREHAETMDALQDAYLNAYRCIGQFRGDAALGTWLGRLVLNECAARRRRSGRRDNIVPMVSLDSNMDTASRIIDGGDSPDRSVTRSQMREILERKLGELPETLRVVLVLRSVEELSVEEVSEALSIPQEMVRSRHFRAKAKLRDALTREVDLAEGSIYEFGGTHCDHLIAAVLAAINANTT